MRLGIDAEAPRGDLGPEPLRSTAPAPANQYAEAHLNVKRETAILAVVAAGLAFAAGLAVGEVGVLGLAVLVGLGLAAAAFVDFRITLLAIVPAMVLLPELPLALPVRTEDLLLAPLLYADEGDLTGV